MDDLLWCEARDMQHAFGWGSNIDGSYSVSVPSFVPVSRGLTSRAFGKAEKPMPKEIRHISAENFGLKYATENAKRMVDIIPHGKGVWKVVGANPKIMKWLRGAIQGSQAMNTWKPDIKKTAPKAPKQRMHAKRSKHR